MIVNITLVVVVSNFVEEKEIVHFVIVRFKSLLTGHSRGV